MFTNLCLVLLLLIAGSLKLVSKFYFQLTKKAREKARKRSDGVAALAQLYFLYFDRTFSFNQ